MVGTSCAVIRTSSDSAKITASSTKTRAKGDGDLYGNSGGVIVSFGVEGCERRLAPQRMLPMID